MVDLVCCRLTVKAHNMKILFEKCRIAVVPVTPPLNFIQLPLVGSPIHFFSFSLSEWVWSNMSVFVVCCVCTARAIQHRDGMNYVANCVLCDGIILPDVSHHHQFTALHSFDLTFQSESLRLNKQTKATILLRQSILNHFIHIDKILRTTCSLLRGYSCGFIRGKIRSICCHARNPGTMNEQYQYQCHSKFYSRVVWHEQTYCCWNRLRPINHNSQ